MKRTSSLLGAVLVVVLATNMAAAAILFDDAFETDTSGNYNVNQSAGNHAATFAYDYSAVGIPPAPGSTTTLGLKVEANYSGGSGGGVSVSPLGLALTGDFNIKMNVWLNAPGPFPAGGSGSTQVTSYGWGTAGTSVQSFTARDSLVFGTTGEAGASQDYLIFPNGPLAANQSSMYAASAFTDPGDVNDIDSRNHPHNYYSGFGGDSPPAAQMALFPQQNGATLVGATAFAWRDVLIQKRGDIVTWKLDGVLIGTVDASALANPLGGSNFFMGQTDINAGSSADQNVRSLLFGLFDNVSVEAVPEPTSLVLLGLCAVGACLARKRD